MSCQNNISLKFHIKVVYMKKCVIMKHMLVRLFTHCYIMLATFFIFFIHKNKKIIVINLHRHWDNSCEALQIKCILKHLTFFPTDMMNRLTDWSLSLFGFNQLYLLSGFSQYVYFFAFRCHKVQSNICLRLNSIIGLAS